MMKRLIVLLLGSLLVAACGHGGSKKTIDPKAVGFDVVYDADFDNVLYTSMLLALANYSGEEAKPLFSVSATAPKNNSVLRVVVDSTALNYVSITQETLPRKGVEYTFSPVIKWKFETLYKLRKQGSIDMTFTCFINDEEVDVKTIRLNYRSVNECLLSLIGKDGSYRDYRWLFTAYVNEDHPMIDNILSEILTQGIVTTFNGAKNEKAVRNQVRAIWYYALSHGIAYSSITCTSNASPRANSQHIRFFDDVYQNRQANCVDACVFFSSIMRKVGLQPIIFVDPCHAYLGYYTDSKKKHIELLEATITGWVNLPELDKHVDTTTGMLPERYFNKVARYLSDAQKQQYLSGKMTHDELKHAVADNLFERATEYEQENYKNNKPLYADSSQMTYQMLVVDELRKQVSPIPAAE